MWHHLYTLVHIHTGRYTQTVLTHTHAHIYLWDICRYLPMWVEAPTGRVSGCEYSAIKSSGSLRWNVTIFDDGTGLFFVKISTELSVCQYVVCMNVWVCSCVWMCEYVVCVWMNVWVLVWLHMSMIVTIFEHMWVYVSMSCWYMWVCMRLRLSVRMCMYSTVWYWVWT